MKRVFWNGAGFGAYGAAAVLLVRQALWGPLTPTVGLIVCCALVSIVYFIIARRIQRQLTESINQRIKEAIEDTATLHRQRFDAAFTATSDELGLAAVRYARTKAELEE